MDSVVIYSAFFCSRHLIGRLLADTDTATKLQITPTRSLHRGAALTFDEISAKLFEGKKGLRRCINSNNDLAV